ncbi:Phosphatidylinositolglycan class N-domain-containing protein [Melampsora americana]|nr:Phosphatidylinositolglycan class N-domain-containing protein [Melampsora americana]
MRTSSSVPVKHPHRHLILGFLFHAAFLASIFDIYFVSPVLKVDRRYSILDSIEGEPSSSRDDVLPLASRVVLIVMDYEPTNSSLYFPDPPFDSVLSVPDLPELKPIPTYERSQPHLMTPAPYLRSLVETGRASWGSRPGHVAIIAGMYEDVSAVTRGWKMNPVNFDSVFNQSSHSFTFGSPDILPMFKHGASDPDRVDAWSYDEEAEDFTKDAAELDIWVLDRLKKLFLDAKEAGPGSELDHRLRSNKVIFFLHLLGLDTTGHSYRPHSPEYFRNVQVVDKVVRGTEKLFEDFYGDDRTAYIFTADHCGIKGRTSVTEDSSVPISPSNDPYFTNWHLDNMGRLDVEQADIAPLMVSYRYLANLTPKSIKQLTTIQRLFHIHRLILTGHHEEAVRASAELQGAALRGLKYLQRYDWFVLRTLVTIGYVGWMILSAIHVLRTYALPPVSYQSSQVGFGSVIGFAFFLTFAVKFFIEQAPRTYYLYAAFPAYFWSHVQDWAQAAKSHQTATSLSIFVWSLISLECMVLGYFQRFYWSVGWVAIGVVWPAFGTDYAFRSRNQHLMRTWTAITLVSSIFTLLPVEKGESIATIALGSACFLGGAYVARKRHYSFPTKSQVGLISAASANTIYSAHKLSSKQGLPKTNQVLGWIILFGSLLSPLFSSRRRSTRQSGPATESLLHQTRLLRLVFSFVPAFIILSLSYEVLFYFCFSLALLVWIELETRLADNGAHVTKREANVTSESTQSHKLSMYQPQHIRLALFFLFFIHVGFFGTGNVASISSFYLEPVYRLVPVFSPFLMSSLLLMKILIPFLILFVSTFVVSDVLTLNFFFLVTDQGSWLEIGQSISHFAIASLLLAWTILLHSLG